MSAQPKAKRLESRNAQAVAESIGASGPTPAPRLAEPPGEAPRERARLDVDRGVWVIPVSLLTPDPDQPRKDFPEKSLEELAENLTAKGQLVPIRARPDPAAPGRFLVVDGERRYRAAKLAGRAELDATLDGPAGDPLEVLEAQLCANEFREAMNAVDLADALARLVKAHGSTRKAAERLGMSQSAVQRGVALAADRLAEPVRNRVRDGRLTAFQAVAIARLEGEDRQEALAKLAVAESMTREDLDNFVASVESGHIVHGPAGFEPAAPKARKASQPDSAAAATAHAAHDLCEMHGPVKPGRYTLKALGLERVEVPATREIVGDLHAPKGVLAKIRRVTVIRGHNYVCIGGTMRAGAVLSSDFVPAWPREAWKGPINRYGDNPSGIDKTLGVEVLHKNKPWVLGSGRMGLTVLVDEDPLAKASQPDSPPAKVLESHESMGLGIKVDVGGEVLCITGAMRPDLSGPTYRRVVLGEGWEVQVHRKKGNALSIVEMRDALQRAFTAVFKAAEDASEGGPKKGPKGKGGQGW